MHLFHSLRKIIPTTLIAVLVIACIPQQQNNQELEDDTMKKFTCWGAYTSLWGI